VGATSAPATEAPESGATGQGAAGQGRVDWPSFLTCITSVALCSLPLAPFPEAGERVLTAS